MLIDYKKELNPEQYQVVTEGDGPCLVLAGAGSGKTRTLVYRVAYLLEKGIKPENILLVTFTNRAANEMMERVKNLLGVKPEDLWGGTFHRIGNLILRKYANQLGYERNFNILDQDDSVSLIKHAMDSLGLNTKGQSFPKPSIVQSAISYSRNTNQDVKETAEMVYGYPDFIADKFVEVSSLYEQKKKASNVMDFDDLLVNWLRLLEMVPEVKQRFSEQFQYILVDEYQDTNYIQAQIIQDLSTFHNNVLVVGDDSQSIYSFRAADVRNILNFPKLFSNAKVFRIETNYRSTPQILNLANEIIKHNVDQFQKKLKPAREGESLPALIPARDEHQQANLVVKRIMELYRGGRDYQNMAVLYRATYQSAEIQLELSKYNIPFVVRGGMRYFEQAHVKDVVSYLKVLANFQDEIAWKRILLLYAGIGEKGAEKIWNRIKSFTDLDELLKGNLELKGGADISWQRIVQLFVRLKSLDVQQKGNLGEAIELIMEAGYEDHLKNAYENYRDRLDDLSQLINFVALYSDLDKLLADVMLSESFADAHEHDQKAVVLSTIHQAKGLEWSVVFIVGLRNGHFPHHKSLENPKELEEERRLFYVAATRAKDELNMLYPIRSFSYKFGEVYSKPSMFIQELDPTRYVVEANQRSYMKEKDDEGNDVVYYD
ncbi:MAG: UvrD/rep helicase [Parcubacteria group bacterium GW2011_GWC2_39_14]|nr:MAG: UvrD/rep helicase [Parcubacteria group bacterium GW2011_GWC2_39_14]KKR54793.1 MAG: UvrD/rep helicase [Parcubacteria group bacterium GW2011_GWA2_40_23]